MADKKQEKLRREIEESIERERQAHRAILATLDNEKLMKDFVEAYLEDAASEPGEPWSEVKARLGLV